MRLASGLGKLTGLTRLRALGIVYAHQDLSEKELDWRDERSKEMSVPPKGEFGVDGGGGSEVEGPGYDVAGGLVSWRH